MTPEQKAAYVNSQTVCALIEAAGMHWENYRLSLQGLPPRYSGAEFEYLQTKYGIHHNYILEYTHVE